MSLAPQSARTFFVTSNTYQRRSLFNSEPLARLLLNVLYENREKGRMLLHEFVIMPNHFHLLVTPAAHIALEKVVQFVKGGVSYRVKKEELGNFEIWQPGFTNHRIHDGLDYNQHRLYIRENPVKARLVERVELFPYSSAFPGARLDAAPQGLKPIYLKQALRGA
jgi:REP-associated tyrosine transposase